MEFTNEYANLTNIQYASFLRKQTYEQRRWQKIKTQDEKDNNHHEFRKKKKK